MGGEGIEEMGERGREERGGERGRRERGRERRKGRREQSSL